MTAQTYSYPQYQGFQSTHCKKCLKIVKPDECLREEICNQIYCPRCVSHVYRPIFLSHDSDIIIELYCGHYVDRGRVQGLFKSHCINCGGKYDADQDVEMRQGTKICRSCFDFEQKVFNDYLMECLSCNRVIRALKYLAKTEVPMCLNCASAQSDIQSQIMARPPPPPKPKSVKEEDLFYNPKKSAPDLKQQAKKQSKLRKQPSQEEISIVSRFSAFDISDNDTNPDLGSKTKKIKMVSKHSVEIRVENYQISIGKDSEKREHCETCGCLIPLDGLLSSPKMQCKICFTLSFDPRDSGAYKSFAFSRDKSSNKHTSAPKRRPLQVPLEVRTMKKSGFIQGQTSAVTQPNPSVLEFMGSGVSEQNKWGESGADWEKQCQICRKNKYMIIRADKKKVCSECYSKK